MGEKNRIRLPFGQPDSIFLFFETLRLIKEVRIVKKKSEDSF